ncbi:acetyl-CoA carboxylase, carboxyltransferase subunit beta [Mycoplasmatota bacterium]|nr:acetyl-CoA carboxylase, carboxyltransferase subunit beta [Mycoplasmatota bacterium]
MENFLEDRKSKLDIFKKKIRKKTSKLSKVDIPDGLFTKCSECDELIYINDLLKNNHVCPKCQYHFRMNARDRLKLVCDKHSFKELFTNIYTVNVLDFPDYLEKIENYQAKSNETDAFICGEAKINHIKVAIGVLDSYFMMGSMGNVVGEKVTRLIEYATLNELPLIIFSASGGARMQEGIFSLMQMAKTSAALKYHHNAGLLYLSVLTNPTTGGVAASFASLGDIIISEANALIGFAGQRVIKQTIRQDLPEGFQTAEFQLNKGFVDIVCERKSLKKTIQKILSLHKKVE